jgi:uncharacterized protein (TIGR02118 family)
MHKLVVLYPKPDDPQRFKEYYETRHLPLVRKMPGLRRFSYSFDVQGVGAPSAWFCIFEAEFDDAAAMGAASGSPQGQAVAADVANYSPKQPLLLHFPVMPG